MDVKDIENRFSYHAPSLAKQELHIAARNKVKDLAHYLNGVLPESREKSLSVTHLEDALMWANAAIARNA